VKKKLLSLAVSGAILWALYSRVGSTGILDAVAACDAGLLAVSLALVAPITWVTALRFLLLAPPGTCTAGEATRLTLAASTLNLVLPSKMGDLAKAWFLRDSSGVPVTLALPLVVFEKAWDMLALLAWCAIGLALVAGQIPGAAPLGALIVAGLVTGALLLSSRRIAAAGFRIAGRFAPGKIGLKLAGLAAGWDAVLAQFWPRRGRVASVAMVSLGLWLLHLLQIWMFALALRSHPPLLFTLGAAPIAILAGLLPLTFAGVGTRDAALVWLFHAFLSPAQGAALGILCTSRYLMPALAGLPFLHRYLGGRQPLNLQN